MPGRWIDAGRCESCPVVLDIPTATREEILPLLDRYAKVIATRW